MGMFDTYHVTLICPLDGVSLSEWQGKDGPCDLYDWTTGRSEPDQATEGRQMVLLDPEEYLAGFSDQSPEGPFRFSDRERADIARSLLIGSIGEHLPPVFTFYSACGDHDVEAGGETDFEGTWISSRILLVNQWISLPGVAHVIPVPAGNPIEIPNGETLELFRVDRLRPEAVERREQMRRQMAALLPVSGGSAVCENGPWFHREGPVPATAWLRRFRCEKCLNSDLARIPAASEAVVR